MADRQLVGKTAAELEAIHAERMTYMRDPPQDDNTLRSTPYAFGTQDLDNLLAASHAADAGVTFGDPLDKPVQPDVRDKFVAMLRSVDLHNDPDQSAETAGTSDVSLVTAERLENYVNLVASFRLGVKELDLQRTPHKPENARMAMPAPRPAQPPPADFLYQVSHFMPPVIIDGMLGGDWQPKITREEAAERLGISGEELGPWENDNK